LQRNYRTNIYGNLLTNTTEFNVEVNPDFDGEDTVYIYGMVWRRSNLKW